MCKVIVDYLINHLRDFMQLPKDIKTKRLLLLVVSCSLAGVIVGGTTSWVEGNSCLEASIVTSECLTQDQMTRTANGMSTGLIVGAGAAFGAAWQHRHDD